VGDEVLKNLSRHVSTLTRTTDTLSRWGGEEFLLLLPETNVEKAFLLAERIRQSVMQSRLIPQQEITISLGVTQATKGDDKHELLRRVDSAMYLAKQSGRNKVCEA
jgi:diguanylate cyclase (GGDEF)-like protein